MKKNYLLGMALIASLSFYSCDKEVVYVQDGNGVESVADGAQIITLQVENGGDGLATRAGRPLFSAEAKQTIENVKLWICDGTGNVKYVKEISAWNTDSVSTVYTTGGHGRQTTIELKDADKLAAGTYQIYAVGYSNSSAYTLTDVTKVAKEGTFNENMVLPCSTAGEEIFAGQMELTVETGKGFKKPIVLNRQVAGAFAYVKDIPFMEGAKYLKLVASAQNQSLVLGNFNSVDLTGNGSGNTGNVKYVVNGTNGKSGSETYEISSIDLNKWFTAIKDEDGDNLIDAGENGSVEISWGLFFILVKYCLLRIMKNDYLNMLASLVLPAQILDYFLISGVEQTSQEIHISLDEKMNPKLSNDEHFESKGFMEAVNVTDFPIRDHKVILKIRRRRWTDLRTGKSFSIPIDLDVVAKGTRYSKEFGAFLKETYGDIPSDLPYA